MAQKILTTQAELDEIFRKMERDYGALNNKQQAYFTAWVLTDEQIADVLE